ncbi:MAG TPA: hypothetical protein EYG97_00960 [Arcobacter sp.]|nr:hypothetical protein [Arcobacter sp.]HIP55573.1 hypothetical protein [Arcobacter sp.]
MIIVVYYSILSIDEIKTIVLEEYILLCITTVLFLVFILFKLKLKNIDIIDFNVNNNISLKFTIGLFLVFQVVDYYYENGFIGMISQWFMYWVMGILSLLVITTINYYKNYKYFLNK